jgi:hypothetical protein
MPLEGIQKFIPAFKHVGSVVRGKQIFAAIRSHQVKFLGPINVGSGLMGDPIAYR